MNQELEAALDYARDHDLDLSAKVEFLNTHEIWKRDKVNLREAKKLEKPIRAALKQGLEWPVDMPLILVYELDPEEDDGDGYELLDGHHRLTAAERAGIRKIPALVVPRDTFVQLEGSEDGPALAILGFKRMMAQVDPLMRKNLELETLPR